MIEYFGFLIMLTLAARAFLGGVNSVNNPHRQTKLSKNMNLYSYIITTSMFMEGVDLYAPLKNPEPIIFPYNTH